MKKVLIAITFLGFLTSCGPSAQELAATQQRHDDSLKAVTEAEVMQKNKVRQEAENQHKEMVSKLKDDYNELQQRLVEDNSKLAVLLDRQKHDAEFHMGRLQSQREEIIKKDQSDIDNLKIEMSNIQSQMEGLKNKQ